MPSTVADFDLAIETVEIRAIIDPNGAGESAVPDRRAGGAEEAAVPYCMWHLQFTLVHRLINGRHTVGFKRVWMLGASEERIRCDT
jgi:ABC-type uncharacterized transport system ATPase subunit